MIKINSGDNFITVSSWDSLDPRTGDPQQNIQVYMDQGFQDSWTKMQTMLKEWQEQKKIIETNPAVKASYEEFRTMCHLAKEFK
jgi:hypothetical protein